MVVHFLLRSAVFKMGVLTDLPLLFALCDHVPVANDSREKPMARLLFCTLFLTATSDKLLLI